MDNKKSKPLGGGVHQLNNNQLFNLQLFADDISYSKVVNPYEFYLNKPTWTKGDIKKVYDLYKYYKKIPNYDTITTLPEENVEYIKEALPNVTDCDSMMGGVFIGCRALTSIDTTGWDTSNITSMSCMFGTCASLTTLNVSNFDTSKVTSMSYMFFDCLSLTTIDVSKWDTSNVNNMYSMFRYCNTLTTIIGAINMKSCTYYDNMFTGCDNLTGVKIKNPPSGFTDKYSSEISSGKIVIVQ